jgi:hypothetical protein
VIRLGQEKTTKALDSLLKLGPDWETQEAEIHTRDAKLDVHITQSDEMAKHLVCPRCHGKVSVQGHEHPRTWPYQKVFDWSSELVVEVPILRCKKCGERLEIQPPLGLSQQHVVSKAAG